MKSKAYFSVSILLSAVATSFGQPTISGLLLRGAPQTGFDTLHRYITNSTSPGIVTFSASPGADLVLTNNGLSGTTPFTWQWKFNGSDLPGETSRQTLLPNVDEASVGDYTVAVTDGHGLSATSYVCRITLDYSFSKIRTDPVVNTPGQANGGTWGDFDNDGFPDLFVFNGNQSVQASFLYQNNANGTFFGPLPGTPDGIALVSFSACWGDYDNDGNLDLYVATRVTNLLYQANGVGGFNQITQGDIVADSYDTRGAAWVDYDQDGFLDMFVTTFDANATAHCLLYHNNGDGSFTSVNTGSLVTDIGSSLGCVWGDYDNDGYPDLFVTGGRGSGQPATRNRLYHNNGNGSFSDIALSSGLTDTGHSGACAWGDYDNDGYLDLFVANINGEKNYLYHNKGDGTFEKVTVGNIVNDTGTFEGCAWGDYDNDGFLDLFVTRNDPLQPSGASLVVNCLYHNDFGTNFTKVSAGSPVNEYSDSTGCSWVDYDNDGFLDLFAARGNGLGIHLYHNNLQNTGNSNAWLTVKLIGTLSNRSAIGAKVRARAYYSGANRWQLRQITGGSGWNGHNALQTNFGLGDGTNVDIVRIEWPSGAIQEFQNIAPGQIVTFIEPPRLLAGSTNGAPQFSLKGGRGMQYDIQASADMAAWSPIGTVTVTNVSGVAPINNTNAPVAARMFYRAVAH